METAAVFALYLVLAMTWILVPLIPAWITYRITPQQTLGLRGPLQGLTLNTSGAFAAYLIVLLVSTSAFERGSDLVGSLARPMWTLEANLVVKDRTGAERRLPSGPSPVKVTFTPDINSISTNRISLKLPGNMSDWPLVLFDIPDYGGTTLAFAELQDEMKIDHFLKKILLRKPIEILEASSSNSFKVGASLENH
jgi:hypothetical protein